MGQQIPHQQGSGNTGGGSGPGSPISDILLDPPIITAINVGQNANVYTISIDSIESRKLLLDVVTPTQKQSYELLLNITTTNTINFVIYGILGDDIPHDVSISIISGNIIVNIDNTHTSTITINARLIR